MAAFVSLEGVAGRGADHQVFGQLAHGLVTEVTDQVGLEQRLGPVCEGVSEAVGDDDTALPQNRPCPLPEIAPVQTRQPRLMGALQIEAR